MPTEFRLLTGQDPDLLLERLNRFVADLGEDTAIGQLHFSTAAHPGGGTTYSVLVSYKRVESWSE